MYCNVWTVDSCNSDCNQLETFFVKLLFNRLTYSCCFLQIKRFCFLSSLPTMIVLLSFALSVAVTLQRRVAAFSILIPRERWTPTVSMRTRVFPFSPLQSNLYLAVLFLWSWTQKKTMMKYSPYNLSLCWNRIVCLLLFLEYCPCSRSLC